MKSTKLIYSISLLTLVLLFITPLAIAKTADLLEMSDELDALDSQEFQAAIDRATNCTKSHDFKCAESSLTLASKYVNTSKDKKMLLASRESLANEVKRVEGEKQARINQEAENRRVEKAREERRERESRANEAEESRRASNAILANELQRMGNENAAIMANVNRQTAAAYEQINRRNSPPGSRTVSQVMREAEAKQAYESSVRESSSDSSSSSSSSSNSNNSKKPEKASDANPYQNNPSWTLYSQAFAGAVNSREATCSKAKSFADREMAREIAIGKVRFVAVSSCVCGHGDLTKTSIDQVWGCAIYVQKKSIYKDGPADTMSR